MKKKDEKIIKDAEEDDCYYCIFYHLHVPGGFFGCKLKRSALINLKPCNNYSRI